MRNPRPEQLDLINKYTPAQTPPLKAEELIVFTFVGADNILNRSQSRWRTQELIQLAKLCPGLPLTLDHEWDDVSKVQGIIFDSRITKVNNPDIVDTAINSAGNAPINNAIITTEGLLQLEFDAAIPINSQILEALRFGLLGKVSFGGFRFRDILCPICNQSFSSSACPHSIPWGSSVGMGVENENTAPYYVRTDVYDLLECSIVLAPNLPMAGVKLRLFQ